ncbi:hypothetical protein AB4425_05885 [Vibrio sp. 10N.261.51.A1]|uniref:Uncharacterized protein n=2 Tax=Vibrio cyclitrophicus TaxID=47951 RepID=A0A7Z1MGK4_9VIBR|nr:MULTISPECIES: hypothetical protein [Vibrio]PMK83203.1 hypothetical protein BCT92_11565 [Vibrio sp. 10N.261.52.E5]PMP17612.1 hypothetical protein BCS91_25750 [Vibrio cyclitrophicus]PMP26547.1 hypothetical protein BCS90_23450 [Vibrio cyclitrophicus]TKF84230.1 hypothetical protein FCV65_07135 [Vibrio sp. F13]
MSINSDNPFAQRCLPPKRLELPSAKKRSNKDKVTHQVKRRIEILEERCAWQREWGMTLDDETLQ